MIPSFVFTVYVFIWALVIRLNPVEPDHIIASAMVLPFLAVVFPVLLFGIALPPGYLRLNFRNFSHAPLKLVLLASMLISAPIFYLVNVERFSSTELSIGLIAILIGSLVSVYAHRNKVKPSFRLP